MKRTIVSSQVCSGGSRSRPQARIDAKSLADWSLLWSAREIALTALPAARERHAREKIQCTRERSRVHCIVANLIVRMAAELAPPTEGKNI